MRLQEVDPCGHPIAESRKVERNSQTRGHVLLFTSLSPLPSGTLPKPLSDGSLAPQGYLGQSPCTRPRPHVPLPLGDPASLGSVIMTLNASSTRKNSKLFF